MDIRKEFNSQWYDIRNVVLSEALTQLNKMRCINADKLTETLRKETSKWERGILVQGLFFEEMKKVDNEAATAFAQRARELRFSMNSSLMLPSVWYFTPLFAIMAIVLFFVLHIYTQMTLLEQVFYPVLAFSVMTTAIIPLKRKIKDAAKAKILADIDRQLYRMGKELVNKLNRI